VSVGRRLGWITWVLIPVVVLALAFWASGGRLGGVSGWVGDGAAAATFWTSPIVDVPGAEVFSVHCYGKMRYEVQLFVTAPSRTTCRPQAATGRRGGGGSLSIDRVAGLPGGQAIYRYSVNGGPWMYYVGKETWAWPPGIGPPPGSGYPP